MTDVARWVAFATDPSGGNPAGVVLDATGLDDAAMLAVAADVGYSETAFVHSRGDADRTYDVRYFSPRMEVPFCGHATVATGVALAERDGPGELALHTPAGLVVVDTALDGDGHPMATLTSVAPAMHDVADVDVAAALTHLGWSADDLDPALPPRIAFAGARHLVLAARTRERLAALDYAFEPLAELMRRLELITVDLVWREDETTFHARNPFPVGGVVEDPATGAAAAAFGAYLRAVGAVSPPVTLSIHQGADLGRPSLLQVDLDAGRDEVRVTGRAVKL